MLPSPEPDADGPTWEGLSLQQLNDWRADQLNFQQWRWDSAIEQDYIDSNQFSREDLEAMSANGIPAVSINRISHQINQVIGMQESNLTDLKLSAEDAAQQDAVEALEVKVHSAERTSNLRRARLDAAKSAASAGIGWIELGRERNPFRSPYRANAVNWREMTWDFRAETLDDMSHVRRMRFYRIDQLKSAFPGQTGLIENSAWSTDSFRQWMEPDRMYRQYDRQNWRDVPLSWNWSAESQKSTRLLEEIYYQVQMEGPIVRLPGGRIMAYEDCCQNSTVAMALKAGMAEIEVAPYARWRRAFFINDTRIMDTWSPLPYQQCPYTPIWCYRESMTGVPYGLVRIMRSIQDAINTMEAKIIFSVNAKQVKFEKGAIDVQTWQQNVGRKNGMLPVEPGFFNKVEIESHQQLNAQQMELYQDLLNQIEIVGGTRGLNPGAAQGGPRSGVLANQMQLQAMAALGEFSANCREATIRTGRQLVELVREDIAKKGNVAVEIKQPSGRKAKVILHQHTGRMTEDHEWVNNDMTLLNAEVALEEVPHTATYRAAQLEHLSIALQSLPPNDPNLMAVRLILTAKMLECSDLPGAQEDAQLIREKSGLVPPSTPEEQAAAAQKQQMEQQQHQIEMEQAMAQIGLQKSKALEHQAKAGKIAAETHQVGQPDPMEQADKVVDLAKKREQVNQIAAKTAHTQAQTDNTVHKTVGQIKDNLTPPEAPQQPIPQQW